MKNHSFLLLLFALIVLSCNYEQIGNPDTTGKGGSMARFAITKNHLYIVDFSSLKYFDLEDALNPEYVGTINIEDGIETIFAKGDNLFLGARAGMHIFDISNPKKPEKVSVYRHIVSCDPVVVSGDYAFVTLRAGTRCGGGNNVLDIIDISNLSNPTLKYTVNMDSPYGLGIADSLLFVCEGNRGLKIFNVRQPENPGFFTQIDTIHGYDVIPLVDHKILIVSGNSGIHQYDFSNPEKILLLSKLSIEKP
jgi:hypothetical protein